MSARINPLTGTKICIDCKEEKGADQFYAEKKRPYVKSYCKPCNTLRVRARSKNNPEKYRKLARGYKLKAAYGISPDEYQDLLEAQSGKCAICQSPSPNSSRSRFFMVDHCHKTGRLRGLLCTTCNTALGQFKDDPFLLMAAVSYLAH